MQPKGVGFFMPAEWAPHTACWMAWPCRTETWQIVGLQKAQQAYATVAQQIAQFEPVKMLANHQHVKDAQQMCGTNVEVIAFPINDSWTRDTGPTFLINKDHDLAGVAWQHNAWGNKYSEYTLDQKIAKEIIDRTVAKYYSAPFVLEGGSISVDGEGTVLVTKECLLNANRNPSLSMEQIEQNLLNYLGAEKVLWLNKGLHDDETDGHIDEIACFVAPGEVLCLITEDPKDINYQILQENLETLKNSTDAKGRNLKVHTIQQPEPEYVGDWRLTLSYMNFYIANGGIVMPAFGQPKYDAAAYATIAQLFPQRKVAQLEVKDIFTGGGGIHCITQQQPKV